MPLGPAIRIVKGAYLEPADVAYPKKSDVDENFYRLCTRLMQDDAQKSGALLHIATDHVGYRDWIAEVMAAQTWFANLHAPEPWSDSPPARRETAYESEWKAEGRTIAYFDYRRSP